MGLPMQVYDDIVRAGRPSAFCRIRVWLTTMSNKRQKSPLLLLVGSLVIAMFCINIVTFGLASASDGEGTATILPSSAMRGTYVTVVVQFTVGPSGVLINGGAKMYLPNEDKSHGLPEEMNWSIPQVDTADKEGYTIVSKSNPGVTLETIIDKELCPFPSPTSPHYNYSIHIQVVDGELAQGDTITITYGDTSGGGPGARVQPLPQDTDFSILTDADGDGQYVEIEQSPHIQVIGGMMRRIRVVVPSMVNPDPEESFDLKVVAMDRNNFRASGYSDHIVTFSSSDPEAVLPEDYLFTETDNSSHVFPGVSLSTRGIQTITVTDIDTGISSESNPCLVVTQRHIWRRIYWGDIHWHSKLSDGLRTPDEGYVFARDVSCLDFTAMSDHDSIHPRLRNMWWKAQERANYYYVPHRFLTLPAYEWTSPGQSVGGYGHKNVYYFVDGGPLFHYLTPSLDNRTPDELWSLLEGRRAITIPHHPALSSAETDWTYRNDAMQPLVEIASCHGVSEYFDPDYPDLIHDPIDGHFVRDALTMGHRLGIIASSDNHYTFPGRYLAAVYSPELTREWLGRSMKKRYTYATTGGRIILFFTADKYLMGSEYDTSTPPRFKVLACGTAPVETVELIKYDNSLGYRTIHTRGPLNQPPYATSFVYTDTDFNEDSFYYVRVIQEGETARRSSRAWSSPVWVNKKVN